MAFWDSCPICGEENYSENDTHQYFTCGFVGSCTDDVRYLRCGGGHGPVVPSAETANTTKAQADSHYRLALLDAALVADGIAAEIEAQSGANEHSGRCRALSAQMRAFAGHAPDGRRASFTDFTEGAEKTGSTGSRWLHKLRLW